MGILTQIKEREIREFLSEKGIPNENNYLRVNRHKSLGRDTLELFLLPKLFYLQAGAISRILVATDTEFIVINYEGNSGLRSIKSASGDRFLRYKWSDLTDFQVMRTGAKALISWSANGKQETWEADIDHPDVFKYNPKNIGVFEAHTKQFR